MDPQLNLLQNQISSLAISADFTPIKSQSLELHRLLEQHDYETIIKDKNLFWLAFYKVLAPHDNKNPYSPFSITIQDQVIKVPSDTDPYLKRNFGEFIEEIRACLLKNLTTKAPFEFSLVNCLSDYHLWQGLEEIKITSNSVGFSNGFIKVIKHSLADLFQILGLAAKTVEKKVNVTNKYNRTTLEDLYHFQVSWSPKSWMTYPIPPKTIPAPKSLALSLYPLYQQGSLCNFTLEGMNGSISLHDTVLYCNGGPVFQGVFNAEMKEISERKYFCANVSIATLKAFTEYLYLGGETFSENALENSALDLFELFVFAEKYVITPLIDCCTNLICLTATEKDVESLKALLNQFNNQHLSELYIHLGQKKNQLLMKV